MRQSGRLWATIANPAAGAGNPLRPRPLNLLPPIPLYRRLLRAHRKHLGIEERLMGDLYIKAEFRAHRDIENPLHIVGFLTEWQLYAQALEGASWREAPLDKVKLDKMSDQQIGQLYELMQAIKKRDEDDNNSGQGGAAGGVAGP